MTAVQRSAIQPYASWPGYARYSTTEPMQMRGMPVFSGGANFRFRDASGSREAAVVTYARPGWVLAVYTSGPDRPGVRTGRWDLWQESASVDFRLPAR